MGRSGTNNNRSFSGGGRSSGGHSGGGRSGGGFSSRSTSSNISHSRTSSSRLASSTPSHRSARPNSIGVPSGAANRTAGSASTRVTYDRPAQKSMRSAVTNESSTRSIQNSNRTQEPRETNIDRDFVRRFDRVSAEPGPSRDSMVAPPPPKRRHMFWRKHQYQNFEDRQNNIVGKVIMIVVVISFLILLLSVFINVL